MLASDVAAGSAGFPSVLPGLVPSSYIDREKLLAVAERERASYAQAQPFPHAVIDDLFPADLLDRVIADLPPDSRSWTSYDNPNERKRVFSDVERFGVAAETFAHALNSLPFIKFLERLTGIEHIIPDPYLHAAGYMRVDPGGFLNLHHDFTMHKSLPLERRLNVLVYLNHDWRPEWGGQLELHSNDDLSAPAHQEVDVEPLFNRTVIFSTPKALHGHRHPVACPAGRSRLLFSCFYFTVPPTLGFKANNHKVAFPGQEGLSRKAIEVANQLLPPILFNLFRGKK